MTEAYSRSISLLCPTCASDQFDFDDGVEEEKREYKCQGCGLTTSYQSIMESNSSRIDAEMQALSDEVISDAEKQLAKAFSGLGLKFKL